MELTADIAYKSLNKFREVLCGDKVEVLHTENSHIVILADGMGSGVKANILATMTAKILGTMILNGSDLEECVETIADTLPVCQVRKAAYSTFSILQIFHNGEAYLVEFDNPGCIFIRNRELMRIPSSQRIIRDKKINEFRFLVCEGDAFILLSDGTIHAGVGQASGFGWAWEEIAEYACRQYKQEITAMRMATSISHACDGLYQYRPGDDTTVAVVKMVQKKVLHLLTGPAQRPEDDVQMVGDFMSGGDSISRIICGGTTAGIVARHLQRHLNVSLHYQDEQIPPIAYMEGIDLVTEGVITLNRVLYLLRRYVRQETVNEDFFRELDQPNGASMVAKCLIEESAQVHLYVGMALNRVYEESGILLDMGRRQKLIEQLKEVMVQLGKTFKITYY